MPIEDDAWGAPVPEPQDEGTTTSSERHSRPRPQMPSRPQTPVLIGGAVVVIAVIVVIIVVSGGGGGGGLAKSAWIQKADAICSTLGPQQETDINNDDLSALASVTQQVITQIRALGLPSQDASQAQSIVSDYQQAENVLEQDAASGNSDPSAVGSAFTAANTAASQFGLHTCAGS